MSTSKSPKKTENLISNVLDILPDRILQLLPIQDAARTSMLSKQWKCYWLSLKRLVFDHEFFKNASNDWQECSNIISNILLQHDGPIHEFTLCIPEEGHKKCIYLGHWLSFLSKNQVRWIKIHTEIPSISCSYIFWCSELVHLDLYNLTLHSPPSSFSGFPKLEHLKLRCIEFSQEDIFSTLMAKCRKLVTLILEKCKGIGHIVIDVPSLEKLGIYSELMKGESIAFRDVTNLKGIAVHLYEWPGNPTVIDTIDSFIDFGSGFCKFLGAASFKRPHPVVFKHLNRLTLRFLDLGASGVLQNIFDMVESCPYTKELNIFVKSTNNANHQTLDTSKVHKALHLVQVKIAGITGADAELQLIEYLLTIAVALETLFYNCTIESKLELSRKLLEMPKASPKARLVWYFGGDSTRLL